VFVVVELIGETASATLDADFFFGQTHKLLV
jgi:hypothetical protein